MKILEILSWIGDFLVDTVILFLWVAAAPFLIAIWCWYHPVMAKMYAANALPLLWNGNWATRACLGIMILFALLPFSATRPFAKYTLKGLCLVGVLFYIIAIF